MSQLFRNEEYQNASIEEDLIYQNIRRSRLHKEETRLDLFPCVKVISWLIPHIDFTTHIIKDFSGKGIAFNPIRKGLPTSSGKGLHDSLMG